MNHERRIPTRAEVEELVALAIHPAVSIMLPTHPSGPSVREDPIRLKSALHAAADRLADHGLQEPDVERLLAPAHALLDDRDFWRPHAAGLALYLAPHVLRAFSVTRPLRERIVVGERFYAVPLVLEAVEDERFHVLALSQKDVRLVVASRDTAVEVDLGDTPRTVADALSTEPPGQRLQQHVGIAAAGERGPIFHGHGGGGEERKEAVRQFLHRVDGGVQARVSPREAPVVVAAVDWIQPIYREVSSLPGLLATGIDGNPEALSTEALGARGWQVVAARVAARRAEAFDRYRESAGVGRGSADLAEVLLAAHDGRVDELLVREDAERWGTFDPDTREVRVRAAPGPGTEELLNVAVIETLDRRGTVRALPPDAAPPAVAVCAIYRY